MGKTQKQVGSIQERFIWPPFSILNTTSERWIRRNKGWLDLGIRGEVGRDAKASSTQEWVCANNIQGNASYQTGTSVFSPFLCELIYTWFCPAGGQIVDPFAGGSV